jgi:nitroreductase
MEVAQAIRTRRTHKAFRPEPVAPDVIAELVELARWAPNHHLTSPWRFRVVGPKALERLKTVDPKSAAKLDRAPTLIVCSAVRSEDPQRDEEDLLATGCAAYVVLLAAHDRGLAGYWRTPGVLRTRDGLDAVGVGRDERFVALLHLGYAVESKPAPERAPVGELVTFLE